MSSAKIVLALAVAVMLATAPLAIAGPYDGQWILSTTSNSSRCGGGSNEVIITDGKISGTVVGQNGVYFANGTVSGEGKVRMQLDAGTVMFKGKANGDHLRGSWNAGHCRGKFRLIRK